MGHKKELSNPTIIVMTNHLYLLVISIIICPVQSFIATTTTRLSSLPLPFRRHSTQHSNGISGFGNIHDINKQRRSINNDRHILSSSLGNNKEELSFSWQTAVTQNRDYKIAVEELITKAKASQNNEQNSLALLFIGPSHGPSFSKIAKEASEKMSTKTTSVAIMGAGVIGGGQEVDAPPPEEDGNDSNDASYSISLLYGAIPSTAAATGFCVTNGGLPPSSSGSAMSKPPSYLLFADPWAPLDEIISSLEGKKGIDDPELSSSPPSAIIAGGISCPVLTSAGIVAENCESTVALDGAALPRGSAVGVCLTGSLGLQTIVAQGCRGVGPTYTVTSVASTEPGGGRGEDGLGKLEKGNVVMTLDDEPALHRLAEVTEMSTDEDKTLLRSGWLLCGISEESSTTSPSSSPTGENNIQPPRDYLVRQVMGLIPDAKAIVIGSRVSTGDTFQFHVRDANTAKDDLSLMIRRAQTERLFAGGGGVPLAALQVSCVARGKSLYGKSNVDLEMIGELVEGGGTMNDDEEENPPVAGFFANGEVGPVGLAGFGSRSSTASTSTSGGTYVHGFTTVVAVLCDFSKNDGTPGTISQSTVSTFDDMEEDAWG